MLCTSSIDFANANIMPPVRGTFRKIIKSADPHATQIAGDVRLSGCGERYVSGYHPISHPGNRQRSISGLERNSDRYRQFRRNGFF